MARALARCTEVDVRRVPTIERVPTIDLFAGAGGLSLAAREAGGEVRLHVDFDSVTCATLKANPDHHVGHVLDADVGTLRGCDLRSRANVDPGDPLLVVGGPPCQPFSKAAFWSEDGDDAAYRRARTRGETAPRPKRHGHRPDERRFLIGDFLRLVVEANTDGFVFENVASLLAPRNRPMLDAFVAATNRAGFQTTLVRANAVEFGVPQRRERVFVLGAKRGRPVTPTPTHTLDTERFPGRHPAAIAGPALAPFRTRKFSEPEEVVEGRWAEHLRTVPPGWNYKAHTAWGGHPNPTFVTETRFWNFLLKLSPDLPSWTIPANPGPWTGPFHWDTRRLRTPELAALQGFPAGYVFTGSRRERVRQVGNAAPPPLAAPMIRSVIECIQGRRADPEPEEQLAWAV
jgi:DNA (cytosine-5)-methyltransferase 1